MDAGTVAFTFDEAAHVYRVNGVIVPGVTAIIRAAGYAEDYSRVDPTILHLARDRGIHVHQACELYDQGVLDEESVYPEWKPYVDAWARCCAKEAILVEHTECVVYHPTAGYCGTVDAIGTRQGRPVLIDRKCTWKVGKHYGVQLAAYTAHGIRRVLQTSGTLCDGPEGYARLCVQLKKDGTYRLFAYDDPEDFDAFEDAVRRFRADQACAKWRVKYHGNGTPETPPVAALGL